MSALVLLQEVDISTTVGADPHIVNDLNTNFLVEVAEGRAAGFLLLSDENADGHYETLGNVWTASGVRRAGVARRLLERARADHPTIARLEKPITQMGGAWIRAVAPDLL